MRNKKGYIFVTDVAVAITIMIIAAALFFYNYRPTQRTAYYNEQLSRDVIGVLSITKISDLCVNPGSAVSCDCPNYDNLTRIVCSGINIKDFDADLLSMTSELIEASSVDGQVVKDLVRNIFVDKRVIDEKRFGFAVLYTAPGYPLPLELYNTETYGK